MSSPFSIIVCTALPRLLDDKASLAGRYALSSPLFDYVILKTGQRCSLVQCRGQQEGQRSEDMHSLFVAVFAVMLLILS